MSIIDNAKKDINGKDHFKKSVFNLLSAIKLPAVADFRTESAMFNKTGEILFDVRRIETCLGTVP
jgi:ribosomal protein L5